MAAAALARSQRWFEAIRPHLLTAGLMVVCAGILGVQVFGPHFIGLADNGDFGKVFGWLSLEPVDHGQSNFSYFQPNYTFTHEHLWQSPYYSSETVLAWIAARWSGARHEGAPFNLRALGAVHTILFLGALAILLSSLRRTPWWGRLVIAGFAVFVFTDVCYAAYLNTFFMDAAALCGLLVLIACAVRLAVEDEPPLAFIVFYGLAGLIYVTSKTQHAIWMFLPATYLLYLSLQWRKRDLRRIGLVATTAILLGGTWELVTADPGNRSQALFNKLFYQIGTMRPQGASDLLEIGVRPEDVRYIGLHSYAPNSPAGDIQWVQDFYSHIGYGRLLKWYVRHPDRPLEILRRTLTREANEMRQYNLSNLQRAEGQPPSARTDRFAFWSRLRSMLLIRWPWHIVVWYALFLGGAMVAVVRGHSRLGWLALMIGVLGIGHFLLASLADCLETGRHLLFFHTCTELSICFALAALVSLASPQRYLMKSTSLPRSL